MHLLKMRITKDYQKSSREVFSGGGNQTKIQTMKNNLKKATTKDYLSHPPAGDGSNSKCYLIFLWRLPKYYIYY